MIPQDKDRLDCIRLAVTLILPKAAGMKNNEMAEAVVDAARKFYDFATGDSLKSAKTIRDVLDRSEQRGAIGDRIAERLGETP